MSKAATKMMFQSLYYLYYYLDGLTKRSPLVPLAVSEIIDHQRRQRVPRLSRQANLALTPRDLADPHTAFRPCMREPTLEP